MVKKKIKRTEFIKAIMIIENYLEQERLGHYIKLCYKLRIANNPLQGKSLGT